MDDPTPLILELAPLNPPGGQPLRGGQPTQGLDVRLFIHTDHHFPPAVEPVHVLVTPQHLGRQAHELLIETGRLPVATAVRLQTGLRQEVSYGGVVDRGDDGLLHHHLLQAAAIPPGQVHPVGAGGRAGEVLDRDPLQRGKKPVAVHCGARQRSLPLPAAGSAATTATSSSVLRPSSARSQQSVLPDLALIRLAPAGLPGGVLAHHWQSAAAADDLSPSRRMLKEAVLSSSAPLGWPQHKHPQTKKQFVELFTLQSTSTVARFASSRARIPASCIEWKFSSRILAQSPTAWRNA